MLYDGFVATGMIRIGGHYVEWMEIDISVWTILRAESATDAPVFDNYFERITTADGAYRATDHAKRIAALATTCGDEELIETQTIADQTGNTIVSIGAGVHASIATRAFL